MIGINRTTTVPALLLFGLACLAGSLSQAAQAEPNEPLVQMIVELINDKDRDMRALGFQQVREEVPGEAATKRFAALVKELPPDGKAGLLEALGDRQDAAARPTVLEMLGSQDPAVRTAALKALGSLGTVADVPLLAGKTATGSDPVKNAARGSLVRLRGDDVNGAIVAAMAKAEPDVRVALLGVLAARNARESLPDVLKSVKAEDPGVRSAALGALRFLADENDTAAIAGILKAGDDAQRKKAELALLAVCSRGGQTSAKAIIAALADADVPSRIALLHGLARAGGAASLEAIVARLKDDDEAVRAEAVRMLSGWGDPAAVPHLLEIAKPSESLRHRVLAIRGLVRLASPRDDKPADLKMLSELIKLARRPQEKCLVLGVLGGVGTSESLALVTPALDDPTLAEEAGLAAVMIAEKMKDGDKSKIRAAMEKVRRQVKNQKVRDRAQKILKSL